MFLYYKDFLTIMVPAFLATPIASLPGLKTIFSLNLPQTLGVRAG